MQELHFHQPHLEFGVRLNMARQPLRLRRRGNCSAIKSRASSALCGLRNGAKENRGTTAANGTRKRVRGISLCTPPPKRTTGSASSSNSQEQSLSC